MLIISLLPYGVVSCFFSVNTLVYVLIMLLITMFRKIPFDTADDFGICLGRGNFDNHMQMIREDHYIVEMKIKFGFGIAKTLP
jgi:hypothetical protein